MIKNIMLCLTISLSLCFAEIPKTINYQGKLTSTSGVAIDAPVNITFSLYTTLTGGTAIWNETHSGVSVTNGLFDVILGSVTPLNLPFNVPYFIGFRVGSEDLLPRMPFNSVPYALRSSVTDSVAGGIPRGVSSLNLLTGDLNIIGEGAVGVTASGSTIALSVIIDPGDCSGFDSVGTGASTNSNVPVYLGGFVETIGQFMIRQSDIGCTGGRIYSITFYSTRTGGSFEDIDIWLENFILSDLSTSSVTPAGAPTVSGATLNFTSTGTAEILFPYGFWYNGDNILITLRKNDGESALSCNWKGDATAYVSARYNAASASFPLTSTANFRPKVKFDFRTPPMSDVVTDVNGITGSVNILPGSDIDVSRAGSDITISYTGTGGTGGFQQLRANGSTWLVDSVTFVQGTNITLAQTGDSITISAIGVTGDNWGTQTIVSDAPLSGAGTTASHLTISNNSASSSGIVTAGSGNANKVWKTDASGNPAWRNDSLGVTGTGDNWGTDSVNHNASLAGSGKVSNPLAISFAGSGTALTAAHSDHTHEVVGPGDIAYSDSTGAVAWSDIAGIPPIIEDTIPLGKGLSLGTDDSVNVNVRGGIEIVSDTLQIKDNGVGWAKLDSEVKDSVRAGGSSVSGDFIFNQDTVAQTANFRISKHGEVGLLRITPNSPDTSTTPQAGLIRTL